MDVSKHLKIRAIVFDIKVLIGDGGEKFTTKVAAPSAKTVAPIYDSSKDIKNITTVTTKYMNKIRQKLGGEFTPGTSNKKIETDGEMLQRSKTEAMKDTATSSSRWLLVPGMGNILDYTGLNYFLDMPW